MTMPYGTADFLANPLTFMDANIVVPAGDSIGSTQDTATIHEFCLQLTTVVGKKMGTDVHVYMLRKRNARDPDDSTFYAYWCPYSQNETLSAMLGNSARFMFTATMDGCSFGVGSQRSGYCRVAHANLGGYGARMESAYGTDNGRELQATGQVNQLQHALGGANIDVINPTDYMNDADGVRALKSTTFGVHDVGRDWRFYTQRYWKNGRTYFLREVTHQV
jgi:hypothetical protein